MTVNNLELVKKYAAEAQGFNEVWLNYPDDQPPLRAKHLGDPRAALTPWLAHQVGTLTPNTTLAWLTTTCFVKTKHQHICIHVFRAAGMTSCTTTAGMAVNMTFFNTF